jgi:pimeloyl-ACP methyl ester carboxylesterase
MFLRLRNKGECELDSDSLAQPADSEIELRTRVCLLPDGRSLGWAEYGHRNGFPLVYFPSEGSSRLEARLLHESALSAGFRLISIDRPGIGCSSFKAASGHSEFAGDVYFLLRQLSITQAGLIAWSGGSPFAMAFAYRFPEVVRLVNLLSPFPLMPKRQSFISAAAISAIRYFILSRNLVFGRRVDDYLQRWKEGLCYADRKQLEQQWVYRALRDDALEAGKSGGKGIAWDSVMSLRSWDFDPLHIKAPLLLWQGGADNLAVPCSALRLQSQLPGALLHTVARQGHLFFIGMADDIFRETRQILRD